jgi:hypothetical protein
MSTLAHLFRELVTVLQVAPESHGAEVLCAELASRLAREPNQTALVAFIHTKNVSFYRWTEGALHLLAHYGIRLHRRDHSQQAGWFIFASLQLNTPSPFSGNLCYERVYESAAVAV